MEGRTSQVLIVLIILTTLFLTTVSCNTDNSAEKSNISEIIPTLALETKDNIALTRQSTYSNKELQRAVTLGIGEYAENTIITHEQFAKMLDAIIVLIDKDLLEQWQKRVPEARTSTSEMTRTEGMIEIYYAAEILGGDYLNYNTDWNALDKSMPNRGEEFVFNDTLYPDIYGVPLKSDWNDYLTAVDYYTLGRMSMYSDRLIFDYDETENSFHVNEPFMYEDALLAALRLYDSNASNVTMEETLSLTESENHEIIDAVNLGIVPEEIHENIKKQITYSQFCQMLNNLLLIKDEELSKQWQNIATLALNSEKRILRQEGMLAVFYAAKLLDIKPKSHSWDSLNNIIGPPWEDFVGDCTFFADWEEDAVFDQLWDNHMTAAYFMSLEFQSPISGELLFDYDKEENSLRPNDPLTIEEAIKAAIRLYYIDIDIVDRNNDWDKEFLKTIENYKNNILNSKTDIEYSGKAYYVSNNGSDQNDGLTEGTAWASLRKVNKAKLNYGDAVFFERGGLWRGYLTCKDGVTYSAYGSGEKPKIYGSIENGAGAEKWTLLEGTDNIWIFYKEIMDCGSVVFNNGESWAEKALAYWDGISYKSTANVKNDFDITTLKNLHFFNDVNIKGHSVPMQMFVLNATGKLYLRCDKGNPGTIYESIEFLNNAGPDLITVAKTGNGTVLDNLCFMYGGNCGIGMTENSTVQNCEVAWFGGTVLSYENCTVWDNGYLEISTGITLAGDGIQLGGINNTATNNYIHDIFDYGLTVENGYSGYYEPMGNLTFSKNLVERCNGGGTIVNWEPEVVDGHVFGEIFVNDNYFLFSGYGWSHPIHERLNAENMTASMKFWDNPNANEGIYVSNNVFYLSKYSLVTSHTPREYWTIFNGNTYVQNKYDILFDCIYDNYHYTISISDLKAEELISEVIGDDSAIIIKPN